MGILVIVKDWGVFQNKKGTEWSLAHGKILEENLFSIYFPPDTGRLIHLLAEQ